jgi:hypothetical protein
MAWTVALRFVSGGNRTKFIRERREMMHERRAFRREQILTFVDAAKAKNRPSPIPCSCSRRLG